MTSIALNVETCARAWGWMRRLVWKALPGKREYVLSAIRLTIGLTLYKVVPHLPVWLHPTGMFLANLFFFVSILALLAPFEAAVMSGVLDKVGTVVFQKKPE